MNAFTYSAFYLPSAITWAVQYDDCPPSVEPPAAWAVRWILGGTTLSLDVRIHWRCRIGHEASCFHGVSHYYYRLDQIKLAIKSIQRGTCRCIVDPVVGFVPWEKIPLWLSRWLVLICCNEKYCSLVADNAAHDACPHYSCVHTKIIRLVTCKRTCCIPTDPHNSQFTHGTGDLAARSWRQHS
jgi:hypothetical protein